jgi:histone deacetylase 6
MSTGLLYDERFLLHQAPYDHPEHPGRLSAIWRRCEREGLADRCRRVPAREATRTELATVHTESHIDAIAATAARDFVQLDPDTYTCRDSAAAARLAAGGLIDLAGEVLDGRLDNGLALLRPPGHHAEADRAMGFCLFNNVAIAARAAQQKGAKRILIVDWDLHHGNGTQNTFYPGTGAADEVGGAEARGFTVNVPLPAGCGDAEYAAAFERILLPIARQFAPELVLVSAGFDAADGDPLGSMHVTPAGYGWMASALLGLADGRIVLALEGGYNLEAISRSAEVCLRALLGEKPPLAAVGEVQAAARRTLEAVVRAQRPFWLSPT